MVTAPNLRLLNSGSSRSEASVKCVMESELSRKGMLIPHQCDPNPWASWLKLLQLGLPLVERLVELLDRAEGKRRPLVFLCHSLGGLILKQAFAIANAQSAYKIILETTSAVAFFGTPHGTRDETLLSERTQLIVRSLAPNISRKSLICLGDECYHLRDILLLFEDSDIKFDILSVYENVESKVKKGQFIKKSRQAMLVDKQLAMIQTRNETCIGLSCEHPQLCSLATSSESSASEIKAWLRNAVKYAVSVADFELTMAPTHPDSDTEQSVEGINARMPSVLSLSTDRSSVGHENVHTSTDPVAGSSTDHDYDILPVINSFQTAMKPPQLPCFMVEDRLYNREFWGRQDILKTLDDVLLPIANPSNTRRTSTGFARPTHLTLCGQGGLGKSELAIQFVFKRRENFDAIFWVRADDPGKLEEDFGNIAKSLGLEDDSTVKNPVASREHAKGWLADPKKRISSGNDIVGQSEATWLIVFDNADNSEVLEEYWPIFGSGSILMTSRDPSAKDRLGAGGTSIDLQALGEQEGAELFRKLSRRQNEEESSSREISRELGGLPLAIAQMAGIVRYQQLEFAEFLSRYRDWSERSDLYAYTVGGRVNLRRGTIASVFAFGHLEPTAQVLLQLCSVLDPDCIQELLFASYSTKSGRLKDFPEKSFQYASARTELLRCSLIQRDEKNKEFSLHRLVQDSVKATLTVEERKILLLSATDLLASAWGTTEIHRRHIKDTWKNRAALYPHVLNVKNLYETWRNDIGWADVEFAALLNEAGWFQHEQGNQPICKRFCEAARDIIEHEQPDLAASGDINDRRYTLLCDILYAQGALANESNDGPSCMKHNRLFLQMRKRAADIRGAPDVRLALSYNQYAVACMMAGEVEEAITSFLTSISTYRTLDVYEKGMDSNPILNDILTAGLKDRESVYGYLDSVSYHTGRFHHALGNVKLDEGLPVQSEKYHKNALVQYQASIGEYHHKTADVCHRVAQHCLARDDLKSAEKLIDQALRAWMMQPSSYGPEIARTTFLKSRLREAQRRFTEANTLRNQADALRRKIATATEIRPSLLEESNFDELVTFWSR